MPTIMISGCADISTAVKAMSAGALDFLEKPVNLQILSARIREAIDCYVRRQRQVGHKTELARQMEKLSARQREVLNLLMAGERCKQIARHLGIGEKTVAKHRATVLEKMQVDNVVELVRLFVDTDLTAAPGTDICSSPAIEKPASLVHVRFQEPRQAVEVAVGLDVAHDRHQRGRIDQLMEGHVVQVQLSGDGDHHAVEPFFHQCSIGAHAELAAEHHVEGLGAGAAALVAELARR